MVVRVQVAEQYLLFLGISESLTPARAGGDSDQDSNLRVCRIEPGLRRLPLSTIDPMWFLIGMIGDERVNQLHGV